MRKFDQVLWSEFDQVLWMELNQDLHKNLNRFSGRYSAKFQYSNKNIMYCIRHIRNTARHSKGLGIEPCQIPATIRNVCVKLTKKTTETIYAMTPNTGYKTVRHKF